MKPIKQMSAMASLDLTTSLANGDMRMPLRLQALAFFLQEDIGQHGQGPEAYDSQCSHQLILIQPQFFFAIAKEDFKQAKISKSLFEKVMRQPAGVPSSES